VMKTTRLACQRQVLQCVCAIGLMASAPAWAANHVIEMLDINGQQTMAFQPEFLKVQPGDSVTFKPSHRTHYVRAIAVPTGTSKFASKEDEEYTVTLTQPGVYFYVCPPHLMMAMIGAIQVGDGDAVRLQAPQVAQAARNLRGRMHANTQRADALIKTIEEVK
jgi:pseudoazurin